jgi:hypothetical protein
MPTKEAVLKQLDDVLAQHQALRAKSQHDDCSDLGRVAPVQLLASMCSAIERFAPPGSQYILSMQATLKRYGEVNAVGIPYIAGLLHALRAAYAAGFLSSIAQLIHADVFADFMEMSEHLLEEGYKDPAAVLVGSVLEEHLRKLCGAQAIPTQVGIKPKKADALNAELAGTNAYTKLDQKSVTAWLDLRNKAAHGKYSEYTKEQVALMIQGVRDFIARVPA